MPSEKFNAGEKVWFWGGVTVFGGWRLPARAHFPNFGQTRATMQILESGASGRCRAVHARCAGAHLHGHARCGWRLWCNETGEVDGSVGEGTGIWVKAKDYATATAIAAHGKPAIAGLIDENTESLVGALYRQRTVTLAVAVVLPVLPTSKRRSWERPRPRRLALAKKGELDLSRLSGQTADRIFREDESRWKDKPAPTGAAGTFPAAAQTSSSESLGRSGPQRRAQNTANPAAAKANQTKPTPAKERIGPGSAQPSRCCYAIIDSSEVAEWLNVPDSEMGVPQGIEVESPSPPRFAKAPFSGLFFAPKVSLVGLETK